MKNENTILDNEKSIHNNMKSEKENVEITNSENSAIENKSVAASASTGKIIATGLGGVLLGTVASSAAIFSTLSDEEVVEEVDATEEVVVEESIETPEWSNGNVSVATSVSDSMSFGEAFATARAEVGAGGAFEWRGNVYGTYLAEEWNSMTAEEKADYNQQFNWGAIDTTNNEQTVQELVETEDTDRVIEPVIDESINDTTDSSYNTGETPAGEYESEVEILGVISDPESGNNFAPLIIDGEPVVLVDINNDNIFDVIAADINDNLEVDENEILDISEYGITVNDVAQCIDDDYTDNNVDFDLTSDDTVDFSGEIDI